MKLSELSPHPQNYREHPDDQRAHIARSIAEHGFYRNVVVARDNTILAGHGVAEAAAEAGLDEIPVVRLDLDPGESKALKILAGDNEIARLAAVDDRALTELLRDIRATDDLLGTGYDDQMLAALVYITRAEGEMPRESDAAAWVGLPGFATADENIVQAIFSFETLEDRAEFLASIGFDPGKHRYKNMRKSIGIWWPFREGREDLVSLRFEGDGEAA